MVAVADGGVVPVQRVICISWESKNLKSTWFLLDKGICGPFQALCILGRRSMIRDRGGIQQTDMMALKMRTRESMEAPPRPASSWTPTPIFGGEVGCPAAAACRLQEKKVTSSSPKIMGGRFKSSKRWLERIA